MKLKLDEQIQPYKALANTTICVSDWHYGHFEFERVGSNGVSPHTVTQCICRVGVDYHIRLVHLGDLIDSVARGPEATRMFWQQQTRSYPDVNYHGNHDDRWEGCLALCFQEGDLWLPEGSNTMGAHGHQAQRWWDSNHTVRRWFHEQTYRMGYTLQDLVHPDADSWILDAGKWVGERFVPPGRELGRAKVLAWAIETAISHSRAILIHGHTHFPCIFLMVRSQQGKVVIEDGTVETRWSSKGGAYTVTARIPPDSPIQQVAVVDLGTALPQGEAHPDGLYEKREVYPFGYVVETQELIRFQMEGFRVVRFCG